MARCAVAALVLLTVPSGCTPQPERTFDPPPTVLYLLRHAEPAGGGDNPGLSAQGQVRAEAIAAVLAEERIAAVYASQSVRTQQTAQPLADTLGLDVSVRLIDTSDSRASAAEAVREIATAHFPQ